MALSYDIIDDPFPTRAYPADAMAPRIIYCHLMRGTATWNYTKHTAPFWRLYWNRTPGASIWLDGTETPLAPSAAIVIAPDTPYDKSTTRPVEHFHIHFTPGGFLDDKIRRRIFVLKLRPDIRDSMNTMVDCLAGNNLDSRLLTEGMYVVSWALREVAARMPALACVNPHLARVDEFIVRNLSAAIENDQLARAACMNIDSFIRFFKKETGLTPQRYITNKRVLRASDLLHSPDLTIDEIAEQCGFCDRNYFTTVFTRLKGMGPAEYRKRRDI
jgi:AraC-like DNA-binding protein